MAIVNDNGNEVLRKAAVVIDPVTYALRTIIGGEFTPAAYDKITATYPSDTVEVYAFTLDGSPVGELTLTYTDSSKERLSTAERTA